MIRVNKYIRPDISAVIENQKSYKKGYELISVSFEEGIAVIQDCTEDGGVDRYGHSIRYYAIRMKEDIIEICLPKHGFIPIVGEIQDKRNEELAEKALLNE